MFHNQKYKKIIFSKQFWGGAFLLVAFSFLLSTITTTPTQAQAGNNGGNATINLDTSPAVRAQSYTYWKLASKCVTSHMRNTIKTEAGENGATKPTQAGSPGSDGTSEGEWFADDAAFGNVYPDGKQTCAQVLNKAIALWGWTSPNEFLKSMGWKFNSSVPQWESPNNDSNKRFEAFKTAVLGKAGNIVAQADDAAMHVLYLNAFKSSGDAYCQGKRVVKYADADATQKEWANNNTRKGALTYTGITLGEGSNTVKYIYTYNQESNGQLWRYRGDGWGHDGVVEQYSCKDIAAKINSTAVALRDWNKAHEAAAVDPNDDNAAAAPTDEGTENTTSCAVEGVGWIVCPVINFLANIADGAFGFLADSFLRTDSTAFNADTPTYRAWVIMRNVANVLFVIAFLTIIFSQLTSMGISNYGVKKMLPRLVITAILVNISFFIAQLAIDVSNILGYSIRDVFDLVAEQTRGENYADVSTAAVGSSFTDIAVGILAFGGGVVALYALLSTFGAIILAAALALLMILFILVARQAIVILLVVLAPIAFVALLLPNTEKFFTFWRKTLTAMLLLFPIIALVFGAASLASTVLQGSFSGTTGAYNGEGSEWFGQIIASAVLVLPLFIVPILLKKSLDGVPMLGQMATKFQNRANGNLSKRLGEGYKNSAWGRGRTVRKQARQNYRDRQFAKNVVDGGMGGKIAGIAAGGIGKTGQQQYAQQSLDRSAIAVADKARNEDISTAAALMIEKNADPSTQIDKVSVELKNAIIKGDVTKARAAQSILLNSGGAGLDKLHETLEDSIKTPADRNSAVGTSLRNALNSAGLKGKDNALASWAYAKDTDDNGNAVDSSLKGVRASTGTFSGLSSSELGGQRLKALKKAMEDNPGAVSAAQAQAVLNSPEVTKDMDLTKRKFFQDIIDGSTSAGSAAQRAQQTAQTAAQGTAGTAPFVVDSRGVASPAAQPSADGSISIPHNNNPPSAPPPPATPGS